MASRPASFGDRPATIRSTHLSGAENRGSRHVGACATVLRTVRMNAPHSEAPPLPVGETGVGEWSAGVVEGGRHPKIGDDGGRLRGLLCLLSTQVALSSPLLTVRAGIHTGVCEPETPPRSAYPD